MQKVFFGHHKNHQFQSICLDTPSKGKMVFLTNTRLEERENNYTNVRLKSTLVPSFKPVKKITICGECGFKDKPFEDKCPKCKSPYII